MQIPYSEACERNKDPILAVIEDALDQAKYVLEIGTGTAQHAVHFAAAKPHLYWQTSDQADYLAGIEAHLSVAKVANVRAPIELNVTQPRWIESTQQYDLVYTANTFHIMTEDEVRSFFVGVPTVLSTNATLIVYGPFKYGAQFTSDSNAAFDQRLRSRGVGSAIRDFEWVDRLATEQGFSLQADHDMPANNRCLIWSRSDASI